MSMWLRIPFRPVGRNRPWIGTKRPLIIKTGYATAGGVGAGASQKNGGCGFTQKGLCGAGLVGAGPSASVFVESGSATAGLTELGGRQTDHARTGNAVAGLIGSGASASVF